MDARNLGAFVDEHRNMVSSKGTPFTRLYHLRQRIAGTPRLAHGEEEAQLRGAVQKNFTGDKAHDLETLDKLGHLPTESHLNVAEHEWHNEEARRTPSTKNVPYPADAKTEPKPGRNWIDHFDHLPKGTWQQHFDGDPNQDPDSPTLNIGKPTPERQELHDKIKAEFLDNVKPPPKDQKPVAIFMMGPPASGKSSAVKGIDRSKYVTVDADGIKERLPEYRMAVEHSAKDAAGMAHEESSYLAKQIRDAALEQRKNMLFDGTGANAKNYIDQIKRFQKAGYQTKVIYTDLDQSEGTRRALARSEHTGRYVPPKFIDKAYQSIPPNFHQIQGAADEAAMFNTRVSPPQLVYSRSGSTETEHDPKFLREFHAKWK